MRRLIVLIRGAFRSADVVVVLAGVRRSRVHAYRYDPGCRSCTQVPTGAPSASVLGSRCRRRRPFAGLRGRRWFGRQRYRPCRSRRPIAIVRECGWGWRRFRRRRRRWRLGGRAGSDFSSPLVVAGGGGGAEVCGGNAGPLPGASGGDLTGPGGGGGTARLQAAAAGHWALLSMEVEVPGSPLLVRALVVAARCTVAAEVGRATTVAVAELVMQAAGAAPITAMRR